MKWETRLNLMDYRKNSESWGWQGGDCYLQKDANIDMPECVWNGVTQNEEDISYMFEETTPVKACGDLTYQFDECDIVSKTPQDCKEYSSQVKRRRMLDFDNAREDMSSAFLKSKERIDSVDEVLSEVSQWEVCFSDMAPTCFEDLCESEAWLAECLNDTDINISSDDGNASVASDVQIGVTEVCDVAPDSAPNMVQHTVRSSRNVIFKGRKSYMRAPTKLASAVAYPFDFIKPCEVRGDVTLKDINQKIRTPPASNSKQGQDDTPPCYPTSAFSGKPVVGKTKIPTQGGKGSITIMRTKG